MQKKTHNKKWIWATMYNRLRYETGLRYDISHAEWESVGHKPVYSVSGLACCLTIPHTKKKHCMCMYKWNCVEWIEAKNVYTHTRMGNKRADFCQKISICFLW